MTRIEFKKFFDKDISDKLQYLQLLSRYYPNIVSASSEIINLNAILSLPKGTEHFMSDIHGAYENFTHILNSASGVVKRKINEIFVETISEKEKNALANLIYYPEEKLKIVKRTTENLDEWYYTTIIRLIEISKSASTKFTRSKMRQYLPVEFAYIIEELMNDRFDINKNDFYEGILQTIINIDRADDFIVALSSLIRKIVIDRLHIIGDIFDRGPDAVKVMDEIVNHHSVDIQWGNHDILWIGAAMGIEANIANLLRIAIRYDNCSTLEQGYGISLTPLVTFAVTAYKNDECNSFGIKFEDEITKSDSEIEILKKMHKAIAVIQFKLEGQIIKNNPCLKMDSRLLLDKISGDEIVIKDKIYKLNDTNFPTIDNNNPYELTKEEKRLVEKLKKNFASSKKLEEHTAFLINNGSMYLTYNSNLLYHGCIPLDKNGEFLSFEILGEQYKGKHLLDKCDSIVREAFYDRANEDNINRDFVWYLWCGAFSPLFGKREMTTFERYFIDDKSTHSEGRNAYYDMRDNEEIVDKILLEFGLPITGSHIVNGHVPVKAKEGETPIFANGKLIVIDGGLSKAYQKVTGIAGYTLIYNSYNMLLVAHKPMPSKFVLLENDEDYICDKIFLQDNKTRKRVGETDLGVKIKLRIDDLNLLLIAYKKGFIKENNTQED